MSKRLVIIGNAPLATDCSGIVDSSDFVVRFNLCVSFGENTGTRTDALCLNNTGKPARQLARGALLKQAPFNESVEEIWFPRPRQSPLRRLVERLKPLHSDLEYGDEIIRSHGWHDKRVEYLLETSQQELWKKLLAQGIPTVTPRKPSSGIIAIEYVLSERRFAEYEKLMLGFTFKGWKRHPWELERRLVESYTSCEQLRCAA